MNKQLLTSPYVYSSWNGGARSFKKNNVHYQNINGACHTLLYQYKNQAEVGSSLLVGEEFRNGIIFWAKYHQKVGHSFIISPSLLTMPVSKFGVGSGFIFKNVQHVYPGLQLSITSGKLRLSSSFFLIHNQVDEEVREFAYLFNEPVAGNIFSLQGMFSINRSLLNVEYYNFKTRNKMTDVGYINQGNLNITYSYRIKSHWSLECGFWTRVNNHDDYCDLVCIEGFPRIGVSFAF